jgi:hypothetical protein
MKIILFTNGINGMYNVHYGPGAAYVFQKKIALLGMVDMITYM